VVESSGEVVPTVVVVVTAPLARGAEVDVVSDAGLAANSTNRVVEVTASIRPRATPI
jgi:hypothetical protein